MMQFLRDRASWVAKIILVLVVAGFAAWELNSGITFQNPFATEAVEAGAVDVSLGELENRLIRAAAEQRPPVTVRQFLSQGGLDQVLDALSVEVTLNAESLERGLLPTEEALAQAIAQNALFRDEQGNFDQARFQDWVRNQGHSINSFMTEARFDTGRALVRLTSIAEPLAPRALLTRLGRYEAETRAADVVRLAPRPETAAGEPDEAALAEVYDRRRAQYQAPERRVLTIALLTRDSVEAGVEVSDAEVARQYEVMRETLALPEQRAITQWLFDDAETAARAADLARSGSDFATLGEAAGAPGATFTTLPPAAQGVMLPALAEPVFAAAAGDIVGPIASGLGHHVVQVGEIVAPHTPSLEEARDELVADIRTARASRLIDDRLDEMEDALAGGASVAQAAESTNLVVHVLPPLDRNGLPPAGQLLPMGVTPELAQQAAQEGWTLPEGERSDLISLDDGGALWIEATAIQPAADRPLPEVRARVVQDWRAEQIENDLAERARRVTVALQADGDPVAVAAADPSATHQRVTGIPRSGGDSLPAAVVQALYGGAVGTVATDVTPAGAVVARLAEITLPPLSDIQVTGALRNHPGGAGTSYTALYEGLLDALRAETAVTVNRRSIVDYLTERYTLAPGEIPQPGAAAASATAPAAGDGLAAQGTGSP